MSNLRAFHGSLEIKGKYLNRVMAHAAADRFVQGVTWKKGRGCAIGCTLENYNHALYETELGIPEWLARVEDMIFEKMPKDKAMEWPTKFLSAINPGADLEKTKAPFLIKIMERNLKSLETCKYDVESNPSIANAIQCSKEAIYRVIGYHKTYPTDTEAGSAAWSAVESAELVAESTRAVWFTRTAAESAVHAARGAAWSAVRLAAVTAVSAAWSTVASARAAGVSAEFAESAEWLAGRSPRAGQLVYIEFAEELLTLLGNCK